jgi:hypothetical protein
MRKRKLSIPMLAIFFCLIASVILQSHNKKAASDMTEYYWFDAYNNYLWRQSTIAEEIDLTGYDEVTLNPKTLREKGYAPASVYGEYPPIPMAPYIPDRKLYSHP